MPPWPHRNYTDGELVTASILNSWLRDAMNDLQKRQVTIVFGDPIGPVLSTGVKAHIPIPFDCNVVGWELFADASGSIVIDVWRDSYANFPPTVADTIAGTEKPTLAAAQKNQDLALTTWTFLIPAGHILAFKIDSCSGIKQASLTLRLELV